MLIRKLQFAVSAAILQRMKGGVSWENIKNDKLMPDQLAFNASDPTYQKAKKELLAEIESVKSEELFDALKREISIIGIDNAEDSGIRYLLTYCDTEIAMAAAKKIGEAVRQSKKTTKISSIETDCQLAIQARNLHWGEAGRVEECLKALNGEVFIAPSSTIASLDGASVGVDKKDEEKQPAAFDAAIFKYHAFAIYNVGEDAWDAVGKDEHFKDEVFSRNAPHTEILQAQLKLATGQELCEILNQTVKSHFRDKIDRKLYRDVPVYEMVLSDCSYTLVYPLLEKAREGLIVYFKENEEAAEQYLKGLQDSILERPNDEYAQIQDLIEGFNAEAKKAASKISKQQGEKAVDGAKAQGPALTEVTGFDANRFLRLIDAYVKEIKAREPISDRRLVKENGENFVNLLNEIELIQASDSQVVVEVFTEKADCISALFDSRDSELWCALLIKTALCKAPLNKILAQQKLEEFFYIHVVEDGLLKNIDPLVTSTAIPIAGSSTPASGNANSSDKDTVSASLAAASSSNSGAEAVPTELSPPVASPSATSAPTPSIGREKEYGVFKATAEILVKRLEGVANCLKPRDTVPFDPTQFAKNVLALRDKDPEVAHAAWASLMMQVIMIDPKELPQLRDHMKSFVNGHHIGSVIAEYCDRYKKHNELEMLLALHGRSQSRSQQLLPSTEENRIEARSLISSVERYAESSKALFIAEIELAQLKWRWSEDFKQLPRHARAAVLLRKLQRHIEKTRTLPASEQKEEVSSSAVVVHGKSSKESRRYADTLLDPAEMIRVVYTLLFPETLSLMSSSREVLESKKESTPSKQPAPSTGVEGILDDHGVGSWSHGIDDAMRCSRFAEGLKPTVPTPPKDLGNPWYSRLWGHMKSNPWRYSFGALMTAFVLALCFSPLGPIVFAGLPMVGATLAVAAAWVTSVGIAGYFAAAGAAIVAGLAMFHLDRVVAVLLLGVIELGKGLLSLPGKMLNAIAKSMWIEVKKGGVLAWFSGIGLVIVGIPALVTGLLAKVFEWMRQIQPLHDIAMEARGKAEKINKAVEPQTFLQRCGTEKGGVFAVLSEDTGCYLRETMTSQLRDENRRGVSDGPASAAPKS